MNPKHQLFADEYLKNGRNGKQAAIAAGYSEKRAEVTASELLTREDVRSYVEVKVEKVSQEAEVTLERVVKEYARIAFFDIRDIFDPETGAMLAVKDLNDASAAAIAGIEVAEQKTFNVVTGEIKKVKITNKIAALDGICKIMGWNAPEKQQHSLDNSFLEFLKSTSQSPQSK